MGWEREPGAGPKKAAACRTGQGSLRIGAVMVGCCFMAAASAWAADSPRASSAPDFQGHWEGKIEFPGQSLPILVDLSNKDGAWSGTADSPMQGARGIPLADVRVEGDTLSFGMKDIPGDPRYRGGWENGEIRGAFSQSGLTVPLRLGRNAVAQPARPQEPKPPFPYRSEDVAYKNGDITLAGTLTLPAGGGPFPAVLLITGSGAENRDEEVFGHKPFLVLADDLTRSDIVVLRVDDRGVGGSTGRDTRPTSADFARDVLAGVRFLKERPEIDPKRIGLVGHSEGGLIAALAASQSEDVAFVVMLAGPGVPGDEILVHQAELIYHRSGIPEELIRPALAAQRAALEAIRAGADSTALRPLAERLVQAQTAMNTTAAPLAASQLQALTDMAVKQLTDPWTRFFASCDPRPVLGKVRVPVLAVNGSNDLQVDPEQNLPEIEKALRAGGNDKVTILRLPGLNHLFQKCSTGLPSEYAGIEETMNPAALDAVRDWVRKETER
jgi:pimeloyl-ACP methyl ester carboxylesterase